MGRPIVTKHARVRFVQRVGAVSLHDAFERSEPLPSWLGALLFRRGRLEADVTYRYCSDPAAIFVVVNGRVVTVWSPRRAQGIALRRLRCWTRIRRAA